MAIPKLKTKLEFRATISLELSEVEAAALSEMTKYGIDAFLKGYRKQLGSHYISPHEGGLRMLFDTIDKSLPSELYKLEKYRKAMDEVSKDINSNK